MTSADDSLDDLRRRLAQALDGGAPLVLGDVPRAAVPDDVALVLRTSGSETGIGRPVALSRAALRNSADATHKRLHGPGRWVLALPPTHVAGVQVLARAHRAGIEPVTIAGQFSQHRLTAALTTAPADAPLYLSLVPTQLHRLLDDPAATDALTRCATVLIGGSAPPPPLLDRARTAGIAVAVTYGMTETCGGCVYDGVPLDGVRVHLDTGRVWLGGPVLAHSYLDDGPQPFATIAGERYFQTSDLGSLDGDRLTILGRADDVLISGGVNVHPVVTERALAALGGEVMIVGVPEAEWGTLVVAVVTGTMSLAQARTAAGGGPQAPRALVRVAQLPVRGPGKPDRRAGQALAVAALERGDAEVVR